MGNRVTWYTYPAQSYQTAYTVQSPQNIVAPQYYQPTYQTQSVQAPSENQVAPTNYTTTNAAPAATVTAAAPAVTVTAAVTAAPVAVVTEAGDPYGFLGWLNATRAVLRLARGWLRPESVELGGDE